MALFSTAMEFDVFSAPLPEVAADDVVQLVSGFSLDGVVVRAAAGPTTNDAARIVAAMRIIVVSPVIGKSFTRIDERERSVPTMVPARQSLTTRTAPRAALVVIAA